MRFVTCLRAKLTVHSLALVGETLERRPPVSIQTNMSEYSPIKSSRWHSTNVHSAALMLVFLHFFTPPTFKKCKTSKLHLTHVLDGAALKRDQAKKKKRKRTGRVNLRLIFNTGGNSQ